MKRNFDPNAELRLNWIHIFGCSDLQTCDVKRRMKRFDPVEIEWIDDFSCNLEIQKNYEQFHKDFESVNGLEVRSCTRSDKKDYDRRPEDSEFYTKRRKRQEELRLEKEIRDNCGEDWTEEELRDYFMPTKPAKRKFTLKRKLEFEVPQLIKIPKTIPSVAKFIRDQKVHCRVQKLDVSFCSLKMKQMKRKAGTRDEEVDKLLQDRGLEVTQETDCWSLYRDLNKLPKNACLGISFLWKLDGQNFILMVPQGDVVSRETLQLHFPETDMREASIRDKKRELGFGSYLLPPFGFYRVNTTGGGDSRPTPEKKESGLDVKLPDGFLETLDFGEKKGKKDKKDEKTVVALPTLVDSRIFDAGLVILDMGTTCLWIQGKDLVKHTKATVIESLGKKYSKS